MIEREIYMFTLPYLAVHYRQFDVLKIRSSNETIF